MSFSFSSNWNGGDFNIQNILHNRNFYPPSSTTKIVLKGYNYEKTPLIFDLYGNKLLANKFYHDYGMNLKSGVEMTYIWEYGKIPNNIIMSFDVDIFPQITIYNNGKTIIPTIKKINYHNGITTFLIKY